jgi:hypothetical protein
MVFLAACGGGGGGDDTSADAPSNVPAMITISGHATKREGANAPTDAANVMIAAYQTADPNTPVAMATTDATGNYSMVITTNGKALDGYLKATLSGSLDTYLYAPKPLVADFSSASINMVAANTVDLLSNLLCGNQQDLAKGVVAMIVADANNMPVAGATVSSSPAAAKVCYNKGGTPNRNQTMTEGDAFVYLINLPPGNVTVSADGAGAPYHSHDVNARAGVLTTTVIQP